ncbi:hypothetical protein GOV12_00920 [Candidatus Pacearchaeota archaeon]|nr:hypothetical protein [Candidatus Pacearchaeota archaeon]
MEEKQEINPETIKSIEEWAEQHTSPDKKLLSVGKQSYSPREIAREVKEGTKIGNKLAAGYENPKL